MVFIPLLAAFFSAMETNFSKKILEKTTVVRYAQSYMFFVTLIQLPLLLFFTINLSFVYYSIIGGILSYASNILYFKGLKRNDVSDVAPLRIIAIIVTSLLCFVFYKDERFPIKIYFAIFLVIVSICLLYVKEKNIFRTLFSRKKLYVIIAMIFWGIYFTFLKRAVSVHNPFFLYWGIGVVFLLITVLLNIVRKKKIRLIPVRRKLNFFGHNVYLGFAFIVLAFIILSQYYLLFTSLRNMSSIISVAVYNLDVIFMTLLSILLFRERIDSTKWTSIVLSFVAMILFQIWI